MEINLGPVHTRSPVTVTGDLVWTSRSLLSVTAENHAFQLESVNAGSINIP